MKIKLYLLSAFFLVFSVGLFFLPDILASSITAKEQRTVDISSLSSASSPSIETAMSQAQSFSIMEESDQSQLDMVNRLREELNQLFQKLSMPKEPVIVQDYEVLISEDSVFWQMEFLTQTGYGTAIIDETNKKVVRLSYFDEDQNNRGKKQIIDDYLNYLPLKADKIEEDGEMITVTLKNGQKLNFLIDETRLLLNYI
ncbi:hypothetical protein U8U95_01605 [Enterococcus faecium]|uniref:hypothetical protein n=1 Tax=Enterococcus faecium TaxID=1352 RepID=UPI0003312978|nr:hypothetical protein [Enterococcus faecium]EOG04122.1 hypothetical protein SKQ_01412 [Enterococcus faecium EnGen0171]EOK13029.1 hypothetical protein WOY_01099 [Enterococcus faecium EnGen0372]EOM40300.1 hypothetical protein SKS_01004 [Enterococcus faecium EnGen0172]MDT2317283.1 hypothetical protein [Enterococcus faecium]NMP65906.1 hypothetical protein [Enterococcus faecium]